MILLASFVRTLLLIPILLGLPVGQAFAEASTATTPIRVATLLPFVEDALRLADERAEVVASVRRSLHAPLAAGVIDLGNPHSPNNERMAEARPQLVIGDRSIHGRFAQSWRSLGARVLMLDASNVDGTLAALEEVSRAVGGSPALEARIASLRREIETLAIDGEAKVLALFGAPGSFYVMTERAWLGDLARSVGFENAISDTGSERFPGLVPVSDEVMALAQPDLVVLVAHGDPRKIREDLARRTAKGGAWTGLAGARLGVHVLDPELFSANPGLELGRAARELVRLGVAAGAGGATR